MNSRGFSLIELIVVMAIMGTLLAITTYSFTSYSQKSRIESQTKQLYGDLMEYRAKALYEKREWTFRITATGYGIYSSSNTGVAPVTSVQLRNPVEFSSTTAVTFGSQGLANVSDKTVCIAADNDANVDSVVISQTRVQIGKKQVGMDCTGGRIYAK